MRSLQDPGLPQGDCPSMSSIARCTFYFSVCKSESRPLLEPASCQGALLGRGVTLHKAFPPSFLHVMLSGPLQPRLPHLPSWCVRQLEGNVQADQSPVPQVILQADAHVERKGEKARKGGSILFHQSQEAIYDKIHHYLSPTKKEKMLSPVHL